MRVLLDHDVPHELRPQFPDECDVATAQYRGGAGYDDEELLGTAERVCRSRHARYKPRAPADVSAREVGVVIIDVHPIVPTYLERHIGKICSALPIAAEEQETVVVREDGISVPST